ncbi:T9SS type B sorting domain-containing protein [Flavobacterium ajazii]|uniref:T9SS type B sorting domain-containing protein n=1 Tax=Flavobacterium ajazii TaxID=2692318 RepID=UPI0013D7B51E|nr:T9SS type B sorting domain-containing protein [Flavobacterium ajazii]
MLKKIIIPLLSAFLFGVNATAQYATKHYIAPSPWQYWSNANEIVISTIASGTVTVDLKRSNGTAITTLTLTSATPVSYRFAGDPTTLVRNPINSIASNRGLIVEATSPVSVNLRNIASDTPGTSNANIKGNASLVSFGNEGVGLAFRLGYYRSSYTGLANDAPVYSVMAIENGTAIYLNGTMTALLNAGQSRLFVAPMGSLLTSDKPIVANVGSYGDTPQACNGNGEDATVDQIAPVNMLGKRYMLVRGNGTPGTNANDPEQSTIIASEANTTVQMVHFDASGTQIGTSTQVLTNAGSYVTIHHGDAQNMYSSTFVNADKPVVVYSATAVDCETDISTVLPIGGCAGSKDIITRKFISYNNTDLPYFGYTIVESATEPVFLNGLNLETLTGTPRVPIGNTGFYMLRFTDVNIGKPTVINITSSMRLTTSIIQQGEGFSMSGFFSAFSDTPEPPAKINSTNTCSVTLSTTPGLAPYQWYLEGIAIPEATAENYDAVKTGNYTVVATRDCGLTAPSAPVFITLTPCSDLKVEKEVSAILGNQATFKITASNISTNDDTNVRVTDLLPSGYQFVSAAPGIGAYNNTTGIWTIGNLTAGSSQTLTIVATILNTGNFINVATISGTNTDTDLSNNTAQAIAQISALTLTKTAQKDVYYNVGETILYDLVLTNSGQTSITNIVISDANADAGSITPNLISALNSGESVTISASHTITSADGVAGFVSNQATVTGENAGNTITVLSDNPKTTAINDATVTTVTLSADLLVSKTNNQTIYVPGTTTVYDITITNNGPSNALNVTVNDPIPAGITTMNWTGNGKSGSGNLTDIIGNIPVGTTISYKVTVVIPDTFSGNLTNTVAVSGTIPDPNPTCTSCTDIDTECTPPAVQTPTPITECDDAVADGLKIVNLTAKNSEITNQDTQLQVTYYLNSTDYANEIPIANPQNFQTTIPYSQTVIAEISNAIGCKIFIDLQIQITKKPEPVSLLQKTICQEDFYDLTVYEQEFLNGQTGNSIYGYFRSRTNADNNSNVISNPNNYTINSKSESIFIRVENATGCFAVAELRLNIIPVNGIMLLERYTICYDSNGNLIAPAVIDTELSTADYTFKWYKDGQLQTSQSSSFTATQPGNYTVEVTNSFNCPAKNASTNVVISNGPESLKASVTSEYFSDNAIIVATATGSGKFVYWLDDGPEQEFNTFYNVNAGTHLVHVKDAGGCAGILTVEVNVIDYPKFFTPNGDGYNDTWNITSLREQQKSIIYIFDRYGKLLTSIKPSDSGWDGRYNGNTMPASDYWFKVNYFENQTEKEFRAHFSLKR